MNKQTIEVLEETKTSLNKHFSQWGDTELTINPVLDDALSTAIQALKALESAEKVLPEKTTGHRYDNGSNSAGYCNGRNQTIEDFKPIIARLELDVAYWGKQYQKKDIELEGLEEDYKGSKEIWESVTKPLIAQKDLRIEELLKYEWEMRKQLSYLTPQGSEFVEFEECYNYIKEQLREGHEAKKQVVYERRELQSLKDKLTVENIKKYVSSCKRCNGYGTIQVGWKDGKQVRMLCSDCDGDGITISEALIKELKSTNDK